MCKVLYFQLRRINKICSFLTVDAANTLAFILSRLDYCNSLLAGLPGHNLAQLQRIQNTAARFALRKPRCESTTTLLKIFHWLPGKARIEHKVSTLCYQRLNSVTLHSNVLNSTYVMLFFLTFSTFVPQLSVRRCFPTKRAVQGRQSIQLGRNAFSNLASYKSVKAIFVHINLERKEWISCNDVSCIM